MTLRRILLLLPAAFPFRDAAAQERVSSRNDSAIVLPRPAGQFAVGVRRYHWIDSTREEIGTEDSSDRRELIVRVWYPANGRPAVTQSPYVPQLELYVSSGLLSSQAAQMAKTIRHYAADDVPVLPGQQRFPLVVFSGGNGEVEFNYTAMMTDLASRGFVVASIAHPGVAHNLYPTGRVLRRYRRIFDPKPPGWDSVIPRGAPLGYMRAVYDRHYDEAANILAGDVSFAIDRLIALNGDGRSPFNGRIDIDRIATFGHSYGGNVAVEACARDHRVKACLQTDGGAFSHVRDMGLRKPYMLIRPAFDNDSTPRDIAQAQLFGSMKADAYEVNISGANHRSFLDGPFLDRSAPQLAAIAERAHRITGDYAEAFLRKSFYGTGSPLLEKRPDQYHGVYLRKLRLEYPDEPYDTLRARARTPSS
jgi:predicted dienelactone hydrolase